MSFSASIPCSPDSVRVLSAAARTSGITLAGRGSGTAPIHAAQHYAMKVDVEIGGRAEVLDQRAFALHSLEGTTLLPSRTRATKASDSAVLAESM